jgi:hypothetical protein
MVIVVSLLFVLFAAALLFGGRAAIGPLLRHAFAAPDSLDAGAVVYAMPDGTYCRQMSFDNATAAITGGGLVRCPGDIGEGESRTTKFEWGGGH